MHPSTQARLLATTMIAVLCLGPQIRAEKSPQSLSLYMATNDTMLSRALYSTPSRLASKIAPNGAISVNAEWESGLSERWFIEQQRYGADLVQAGLVRNDRELVQQGWKVLDWGFAKQGPNGDFPGTGDPFHSTSFFVEASARALLLHRQSGRKGFEDVITQHIPKVAAAARWLMRPEVARKGQRHNLPYTHRRWVLAAALGETASLTDDRAMAKAAADYARDGLAQQTPAGINPEKGGSDVSYQAVGILFAARYFTTCPDVDLRMKIKKMIDLGLRWVLTKVDAQGHISLEGSTRTGKELGRSGTIKTIDYKNILQALVFGTAITGDAQYKVAAEHIAIERTWIKPQSNTREEPDRSEIWVIQLSGSLHLRSFGDSCPTIPPDPRRR